MLTCLRYIVFEKNLCNLLYHQSQGSENKLIHNWTWTCETICHFEYTWYPFDTQSCGIQRAVPDRKIRLNIKNVTYQGVADIGKYYFMNISYCTIGNNGAEKLYIDLTFRRPLIGNLLTMFLPTGMLLMISQMSTVFQSSFLDMVISANITVLLCLTTQ